VLAPDVLTLNGLDGRRESPGVVKQPEDLMSGAVHADTASADARRISARLTHADDDAMIGLLVDALQALVEAAPSMERQAPVALPAPGSLELESVMRPRDAFFARVEQVPVEEAVGRVVAEMVSPYPPGVPVLAPGERITQEAVDHLTTGVAAGMLVPDAADLELKTVRVVAGPVTQRAGTRRARTADQPWRSAAGRSDQLAGVHQSVGDVAQLGVGPAGHFDQRLEGLVGGQLVPLDEDALGLVDDRPGLQRELQVASHGLSTLVVVHVAQCHRRVGPEAGGDRPCLVVERVGFPGVDVQRPGQAALDLERHGQGAEVAVSGGPLRVVRPP
jgi:hypothetical protein